MRNEHFLLVESRKKRTAICILCEYLIAFCLFCFHLPNIDFLPREAPCGVYFFMQVNLIVFSWFLREFINSLWGGFFTSSLLR